MNLLDFERMDRIGVIADAIYDKPKEAQEFKEKYSIISYGADTHIITLTKKEDSNVIRSYDIIKLEQGMGRFSYHLLKFHKYTRGY